MPSGTCCLEPISWSVTARRRRGAVVCVAPRVTQALGRFHTSRGAARRSVGLWRSRVSLGVSQDRPVSAHARKSNYATIDETRFNALGRRIFAD